MATVLVEIEKYNHYFITSVESLEYLKQYIGQNSILS
jgi:hypothetical protein